MLYQGGAGLEGEGHPRHRDSSDLVLPLLLQHLRVDRWLAHHAENNGGSEWSTEDGPLVTPTVARGVGQLRFTLETMAGKDRSHAITFPTQKGQ